MDVVQLVVRHVLRIAAQIRGVDAVPLFLGGEPVDQAVAARGQHNVA